MNITINKRQVYSEVFEFLNQVDNEYKDKIPQKLKLFFENQRDLNYIKKVYLDKPLEQQNLKRETLVILAMINLKYWCNAEEKIELERIYNLNEENYQIKVNEKYNCDNIFKKDKRGVISEEDRTSNVLVPSKLKNKHF